MKLKDFDFRVWYSDSESLLYANKEHLFLGYSQRECGEVIQEYGELKMHAYLNDEPLCPDACEIELFTGFCDTNGKRIYEGDIVSFEADSHDMGILIIAGKVVFKNGRFIIERYEKIFLHYSFYDFVLKDKGIKIIGNIHENSELLGGEE